MAPKAARTLTPAAAKRAHALAAARTAAAAKAEREKAARWQTLISETTDAAAPVAVPASDMDEPPGAHYRGPRRLPSLTSHGAACPFCLDDLGADAGRTPCLHPICGVCMRKTTDSPRKCMYLLGLMHCHAEFVHADLLEPEDRDSSVNDGMTGVSNADAGSSAGTLQLPPVCQSCESAPATHHCATCAMDLCEDEAKVHERAKATRDHAMQIKLASAGSPGAVTCRVHANKLGTLYCVRCNQIACSECILSQHEEHPLVDLAKGIERQRAVLASAIDGLEPQCRSVRACIDELERQIGFVEEQRKKTAAQLAAFFDPCIKEFETRTEQLRNRKSALALALDKGSEADIKTLLEQKDTLLLTCDHFERACAAVAAVQANAAAEPHLLHARTLKERERLVARLRKIGQMQMDVMVTPVVTQTVKLMFTKALPESKNYEHVLLTNINELGILMTAPARGPAPHFRSARDYSTLRDGPGCHINLSKYYTGLNSWQCGQPHGAVFTQNGELMVSMGEKSTGIFPVINGAHVAQETRQHTRMTYFSALALAPNGGIWGSDTRANKSNIKLMNGSSLTLERTIYCRNAVSIFALDDGALLVGCDGNEKHVTYLNPDGSRRWTSAGPAEGMFEVACVAAVPHQELAVCFEKRSIDTCDSMYKLHHFSLETGEYIRSVALPVTNKNAYLMYEPLGVVCQWDPVACLLLCIGVDGPQTLSAWTVYGQRVHSWQIQDDHDFRFSCLALAISPVDGTIAAVSIHCAHLF